MTQFQHSYTNDNPLKDEYRTPAWIFYNLDDIFHFTLDPAATHDNHLCDKYYTKQNSGLTKSWENETVFCNPPYTRGSYGQWVEKASTEFLNNAVTSVFLIPFNVETKGFRHVWSTPAHYLVIPFRRVRFLLPSGAEKPEGATFMSCLPIFTYRTLSRNELSRIHRRVGRIIDLYSGLFDYRGGIEI